MAGLFGLGGTEKPKDPKHITASGPAAKRLAARLFGKNKKGKKGRENLAQFLESRVPLGAAEQSAMDFADTLGPLLPALLGATQQGISTFGPRLDAFSRGDYSGLAPVDMTPAFREAERFFTRVVDPRLASSFAGNLFNTDYDRARINAANDLAYSLGTKALDLRENQVNRALASTEFGLTDYLKSLAEPLRSGLGGASDLLRTGAAGRVARESVRPGAAPPVNSLIDAALTPLSGVESTVPMLGQIGSSGGLGLGGFPSLFGGGATGGALGGAAQGAQAGSAFGPWGTAIGALAGGLGGYFSND